MNRPIQLYDREKQESLKAMPVSAILEFLENVRRITPIEVYQEIHRDYIAQFYGSTPPDVVK